MAKKKKDVAAASNSGAAILTYVESIERLEEQKAGIGEAIKEQKQRAKAEGFDAGIICDLVKIRADEKKHKERLQLLETYACAIQLDLWAA